MGSRCLVTRAIHLEVVHALSTEEFMMGLSRFIDTRGRPDTIYSDNGTNFVGASKELKLAASEIDFEVMTASGRFGPVKWKFNPPRHRTLEELGSVSSNQWRNACERRLMSHSLIYVSSGPTKEDSLTPNHFLSGANNAGPFIPKLIEANNRDLREQWKRAQQLTNEFWIKWTRDYILKLMTRSKWHHQTEPIRTGHLEHVEARFCLRCTFGPDGQVRVATITTKQIGKAVIYKRPVTKIYPLD
ncbi:hypothetical protein LAZ67_11002135 [Cordylochernes scorpioides]|uniref:DUF5641 domain-containing protein n=1 Tax=Cordylochernes scorpioides TaxID=51811 RepID=A0ABY6KZH9_9ARAC|nr:hypothetical protein LAZ67_11002135 [Cordylochernes scorpioides]